jgi:DNA-binding CsgD family transcriptional regulator
VFTSPDITVDDARPALAVSGPLTLNLIDQLGSGLVVCDADARVLMANRAARSELHAGRLLQAAGGVLRRAPAATGELAAAVRMAATKGRRSLVRLTAGDDRLHLSILPLQDDRERLVLVLLGRRRACSDLELELLAGSYGLTQAERRVLAGLMQEARPTEIAKRHAVKLSTVRTQISSIRAKLGTRSVEGLLLRAAEVPAMPPALGFESWASASS